MVTAPAFCTHQTRPKRAAAGNSHVTLPHHSFPPRSFRFVRHVGWLGHTPAAGASRTCQTQTHIATVCNERDLHRMCYEFHFGRFGFAGPAPFRLEEKGVCHPQKKKPLRNNISATHDNNSRFYLTNRRSKKDLREKGERRRKKGRQTVVDAQRESKLAIPRIPRTHTHTPSRFGAQHHARLLGWEAKKIIN